MGNAHLQLPESERKGEKSQRCLQTCFSELLASSVIYLKLDRSFQSKQYANQKFNFKARTSNPKKYFHHLQKKIQKSQNCSAVFTATETEK